MDVRSASSRRTFLATLAVGVAGRAGSVLAGQESGRSLTADVVGTRAVHTATRLPDGRTLLAGGCIDDGCATATSETVIVAGDGNGFALGPAMNEPRDAHTATSLPDGRILVVGGFGGEGQAPLASAEVFDPGTNAFSATGPMEQGRGGHIAAALADGRVLVAGGWIGRRTYTASAEIWDPATATFAAAAVLPLALDGLAAVKLADGRLLVTGARSVPGRQPTSRSSTSRTATAGRRSIRSTLLASNTRWRRSKTAGCW